MSTGGTSDRIGSTCDNARCRSIATRRPLCTCVSTFKPSVPDARADLQAGALPEVPPRFSERFMPATANDVSRRSSSSSSSVRGFRAASCWSVRQAPSRTPLGTDCPPSTKPYPTDASCGHTPIPQAVPLGIVNRGQEPAALGPVRLELIRTDTRGQDATIPAVMAPQGSSLPLPSVCTTTRQRTRLGTAALALLVVLPWTVLRHASAHLLTIIRRATVRQ
jgi:hypothetical protein